MTVLLTISILMSPFVAAAVFAWAAHRSDGLRVGLNQFRVSAPMRGQLSGDRFDDPRMQHDLDAIRTRFEQQPAWPMSGALGERR
jgi:hypothetical protein